MCLKNIKCFGYLYDIFFVVQITCTKERLVMQNTPIGMRSIKECMMVMPGIIYWKTSWI